MAQVNGINGLNNYATQLRKVTGLDNSDQTVKGAGKTFGDYLDHALSGLNSSMKVMDQSTTDMISGKQDDLGQVMINMTESQLTLQTAVQVRNKALEAYNDLKNMQF
ncbi:MULTISPECIES: flagellar hook-basal body complex protein FliE [Lactobacillaceae]|jgi:flagellar hook-basal body complex protein FliE|uniref:Flagellar hook-basal body complex protein FliE n=3 Tax=Lactobacillaceae TaxID=33958 RepID=A0A0B2XLM5_LATCU|nr:MULTISPECIES: flagellar hook-basal body complex protein FliE [Lactobacillaceae]AJA33647.1 flagellar hook-basal body complex protein FliE [Ligilactobacillus acidipiscis]AJA33954.1 flagellar hook-basal body complex protein FliE [Latilactobacillus curvatus]ANY12594.1 flagellar hook-basal body complex protein FliE [Latilactobacillus curvatus]KHO12337.1 flagellar hook-basal body complex protein FliE [Latilactobacillus curvatus]KRM27072.1 flagellar hook-basal body complex protein FliE [Ligilactob